MSVAIEIRRLNQTPGRCIACDCVLPPTKKPTRHSGGRKRSALCGDPDCLRVYHQLWRSVVRELRGAAGAVRRASRRD